MAYIQIEYTEPSCKYNLSDFCGQCLSPAAEDLGCEYFRAEKMPENTSEKTIWIPFGDCYNVEYKKKHKGFNVKHYEAEEVINDYSSIREYMILETRKARYFCDKVVIDGVTIYPADMEENK